MAPGSSNRQPWASTIAGRIVLNGLVVLAIALGAAARIWGASVAGDIADVSAYRHHVFLVETGKNVYNADTRYPYFPGWLGIEMAVWWVSQSTHWLFWWAIRMVIVGGDVATSFAVWWVAAGSSGSARGRLAAIVYSLSPIAILISGNHGQFDALPTLLSVVAVGLLIGRARPVPAGILLGAAMALKPFPALLLPIILRAPELTWRARLIACTLSGVVVLAVTAPFLILDPTAVLRNVGGYGGLNDQGFGGVLRSLWLFKDGNIHLPGEFGEEISATTRYVALGAMASTLVLLWRAPIPRVAAAIYLAFLATFGGISAQYLIWPVAWLVIADLPIALAIAYSIVAAAEAIGFYLVYWPTMILPETPFRGPALTFIPVFVGTQIAGYVGLLGSYVAAIRRVAIPKLMLLPLAVCLAATALAIVPVIAQIQWFAMEWLRR
ncbi:MAG: hypothetical protein EPO26_05665 [Chloroflexota bacterium]|nr:MAG: hypothetical protein EPO26_05665 [Chloroflexota bacterium]